MNCQRSNVLLDYLLCGTDGILYEMNSLLVIGVSNNVDFEANQDHAISLDLACETYFFGGDEEANGMRNQT